MSGAALIGAEAFEINLGAGAPSGRDVEEVGVGRRARDDLEGHRAERSERDGRGVGAELGQASW